MATPIQFSYGNRMQVDNPERSDGLRKKCYLYTRVSTAAQVDGYSLEACEEDLKAARRELHGLEHVKYRLGQELDQLDVRKADYDEAYEQLQTKIDGTYERMDLLEEEIREKKKKLEVLKRSLRSSEDIYRILNHFDAVFARMDPFERRELCRQFIERIEIFPEEREDKRILKRIEFRIPVCDKKAGKLEGRAQAAGMALAVDCGEQGLTAAEAKATYSQIRDYVWEHYGKKVSTLNISQVKRKYGLEMGKAYNKPAQNKYRVPGCTKEKERMIMEALKHFRMMKEDVEWKEGDDGKE